MKRKGYKLVLLLGALALSLCSCRVNLLHRSLDVPWWTIAIPVALIVILAWYFGGKYYAQKTYICPQCGGSFEPKWWLAAFTVYVMDARIYRCPHCGRRGFCHLRKD